MSERILIFGNGQIGNKYLKYFKNKHEVTLSDADITDNEVIDIVVKSYNPSVIINTAAITNLEYCDTHMTEVFDVNTRAAYDLAKTAAKYKAYFIHFSSGCIFESRDETDIKTEIHLPNPSSYYAYTKAWGDSLITKYIKDDLDYLILRPRQPISEDVHYKNMLMKLLTFTKYIDTPNTLTSIDDLMIWTEKLMSLRYKGIVNVANKGFSSPYKIAKLLKKYILPELEINKISKEELDKITPVKRVDAVLDVSRLESLVGHVRTCENALEETVQRLRDNFNTESPEIINKNIEKTLEQTKTRATPNTTCELLKK